MYIRCSLQSMYCHTVHVKIVNMVLIGVMHRQVRHTCTVVHKRQTSLPRNSVNSVRFITLRCVVFELSASENSAEFPSESGSNDNDLTLTRYKV